MSSVVELLLWLGGSAARYWTVAWIIFALWFVSALWPSAPGSRWRRWNHPAIHAGLMLLMLLAFRWPGITDNFQLANPDESQLLAGAITLSHHGYYWGVVDCGSSGPLDMAPLILPRLFGWAIDFTSARCIGLLLFWGGCISAWLILGRVAGDRMGRILVMPMACWGAFTIYSEFVQYSSEQAAIFFSALAAWLAFTSFSPEGVVVSRKRLALAGAILALLPFAKVQAAPFTLCIGGWTLILILRQAGRAGQLRLGDAAWLVGGGGVALAAMGAAVMRGGGWADFYATYCVPNFKYAANRAYPWTDFFDRLTALVKISSGFSSWFYPSVALAALGWATWRWIPRPARGPVWFGAAMLVTGFFVVAAPGREFQHYLQFLLFPVTLAGGLLWGGFFSGVAPGIRQYLWLLAFLAAGIGPQIHYRCVDWNPYLGHFPNARANAIGPVARQILAYARPGDTLVVWGWMPVFHVQTQLPQGTRDAHAERQLSANPLQDYFRKRYLRDLTANRPAIFADAVGENNFGYHDRSADGNENVPWLKDFIGQNYVQVADVETTRIYIRRDRWAELKP